LGAELTLKREKTDMTAQPQSITVVGNLTEDSVLRSTQNGKSVVNNTIAATPRFFDKETSEWKDGETTFFPITLWGADADNFAASSAKGLRVIAVGKVKPDSYEKDGITHKTFKLEVDEIAFSTAFATLVVTRASKTGGAPAQAAQVAPAQAAAPAQSAPVVAAPVASAPVDDFS
jgi:single-strand DNA-binding protein